jgi:hypothetical protein
MIKANKDSFAVATVDDQGQDFEFCDINSIGI